MRNTHTVMPLRLRADLEHDEEYRYCMLLGYHICGGRLTYEHALYDAGSKVQKRHGIIRLCAAGHGVDEYQDAGTEVPKDMREWVALNRSTDEELEGMSKAVDYKARRAYLNTKYGEYVAPPFTLEQVYALHDI